MDSWCSTSFTTTCIGTGWQKRNCRKWSRERRNWFCQGNPSQRCTCTYSYRCLTSCQWQCYERYPETCFRWIVLIFGSLRKCSQKLDWTTRAVVGVICWTSERSLWKSVIWKNVVVIYRASSISTKPLCSICSSKTNSHLHALSNSSTSYIRKTSKFMGTLYL